MDGSPSAVISHGFGSWGSVALVLTLGFGNGVASDGGLVCATPGVVPRVSATAGVTPRVEATAGVRPRVKASAGIQEC
jgi:hypothetical protein